MTTDHSSATEPLGLRLSEELWLMPPKPRRGDPCNGCGMCCTVQPCMLAVEFLNCTKGPCVALEQEGGRTYCGFVRRPVHYLMGQDAPPSATGQLQSMLAFKLGIGHGCDSDDEP